MQDRIGGPLLAVSMNAIKVLRYLQRQSIRQAPSLKVSPELLGQVERILTAYVTHVLERDLKSTEFMKLVTTPGERR